MMTTTLLYRVLVKQCVSLWKHNNITSQSMIGTIRWQQQQQRQQQSIRPLHSDILPDEKTEQLVRERLDNYDKYFDRLKLPYKMSHHPEASKHFIKMRLEKYPNGMQPLVMEQYASLYEHLNGEERQKMFTDIDMILLYYNRILSKSVFCPSEIPLHDMRKMMYDYKGFNDRIRYMHFLFVREFDVWRNQILENHQRAESKEKEEQELATFNTIGCFNTAGELQYGFWRNTMFTRYFKQAVSRYSLNALRRAQMFGQKLVIDCSFDETMADYETISVARQISSIFYANRFHPDPFHLMFCGWTKSNRGYQHTSKQLAAIINDPAYCFNLHNESYQELLGGKERLVYLSPDARQLMTHFDPNVVYIIGALVSKTHRSKYTWEKAREQGIECLRLPIHEYVQLKPSVKRVLSFQSVFYILLQLKQHGDWERAFRASIQPHKLIDGEPQKQLSSDIIKMYQ